MAIRDDWTQLNDASTSGDWTTTGFDSPTLNNSASTVPFYIEGVSCQDWPMKKGQTDGHTYDNNFGTTDFTDMLFVFWHYIPAPDVTNIPVNEFWVQISSDTTFTGNMGAWDGLPFWAANPGSFVAMKVYPTNPDETAGTLVINSVDSVGFRATTGGTNDGKAAAFDHNFIISELGGHSETWTNNFFTDMVNDANGDLAKVMNVFTEAGDFYQSNVNIAIGNDVAANTTVTETSKTVFFENIQPEQALGYIFYGGSTGQINVTLSACTHFWNSQESTAEIFTQVAECDIFRVNACSFGLGGATTLATHISDANTYLTNSSFTTCQLITPDTMLFTGNIVSDTASTGAATGALELDSTSNRVSGCTFTKGTGASHAIVITTTGTYTFTDHTFSGYNAANGNTDSTVRNESGGAVTINLVNVTGAVSYQNGSGASTTVNNTVTVTVGGLTEGAAVKIIANETVGTRTTGDTLTEQLADSAGEIEYLIDYEAAFEPSGLDVIVRARQQGLPNFGISQDNTTYVDETTESNSATTNDMNLLVNTSPVAGQDFFYFGHAEQFNRLKLNISTAMAGGAALDFEYWNGAWVNLSGVVDGTSAYTNTGESMITFTLPGDWATTTINALYGPSYFIRIGYLSGTVSTAPRGRKCKLDVTRYLPFVQDNTITDSGLTVTASWTVDSIAKFDDND